MFNDIWEKNTQIRNIYEIDLYIFYFYAIPCIKQSNKEIFEKFVNVFNILKNVKTRFFAIVGGWV